MADAEHSKCFAARRGSSNLPSGTTQHTSLPHSLPTEVCVPYSHRLGDIPDASLQAALDTFGLGRLVATASIPFGLFGQNLFITASSGEYVFRGAPHYAWQLPTERYFANVIHERTEVPVPWPYHVSVDSGPFTWGLGFAIMPRQTGLALADPAVRDGLSPAQRLGLAAAQGQMLAELHRATAPVSGRFDSGIQSVAPFAAGYIHRTVQRAIANAEAALASRGHDPADHAWLLETLREGALLPDPHSFCVVHEDFNHNNMVAKINGNSVTITGLFDLMTCHYGDGLADLARQFAMYRTDPGDPAIVQKFIETYLALRPPLDNRDASRSLLYLIDERLQAWEYAKRPGHEELGWWDYGLGLRAWLQPAIDDWLEVIAPYRR